MKKWIALLTVICICMAVAGCTAKQAAVPQVQPQPEQLPELAQDAPVVGICLPAQTQYWQASGQSLLKALAELGFRGQVLYADSSAQQRQQLQKLIEEKAVCLVVAAVDSLELSQELEQAREAEIPVVAYDRLLMDTDAVDGYVSFDHRGIGAMLGEYIVAAKKLDTALQENRSYTIEFLMGAVEDNGALMMHGGLLSVLQPYLDSGVLICRSGRISFEDTYISQEAQQAAKERLGQILQEYYTKEAPLDICCAATDTLAAGCVAALEQWGAKDCWPLVTGSGATENGVKRIIAGSQTMTVYKDRQELAAACAGVVQAFCAGEQPVFNDTQSGDNHVQCVPAYICRSTPLDSKNYQAVLVDTGVYSKNQLQ